MGFLQPNWTKPNLHWMKWSEKTFVAERHPGQALIETLFCFSLWSALQCTAKRKTETGVKRQWPALPPRQGPLFGLVWFCLSLHCRLRFKLNQTKDSRLSPLPDKLLFPRCLCCIFTCTCCNNCYLRHSSNATCCLAIQSNSVKS